MYSISQWNQMETENERKEKQQHNNELRSNQFKLLWSGKSFICTSNE
jgi:hypothetical protein